MTKTATKATTPDYKKLLKVMTHDAIDRAYVISALEFYSKYVLENEAELKTNSFINPKLWTVMAAITLERLNVAHK